MARSSSSHVTFGAFAAVLAAAPAARAEARLELAWAAPPGCPGEATVHAAATRGAPPGAALRARADVAHDGGRWSVRLRTAHGADAFDAERTVEGATCAEIAEATALVLGLALAGDTAPSPATEPEPARPPPEAAAARTPADRDGAERDRAERSTSRSDLARFAVSASGTIVGAVLPSAAPGAAASVAWTPGRFRLAVEGGLVAAQSGAVSGSEAGARFRLRTLGGEACGDVLRGAVTLGPCAGVVLHDVAARGTGLDQNADASAQWLAGAGGARLGLPLGPSLSFVVAASALVPFARPTFVAEGEGTVHRPAALGMRGAIGLDLHIP